MMKSEESKILRQVCFTVFEQLAFMFGDEIEEDEGGCKSEKNGGGLLFQ